MKKSAKQTTAGFTLVEVIVAIAIMGLITAPVCASLVLAGRINVRSQSVMEAQLHVRDAVETLMKEGITESSGAYREGDFPGVKIKTEKEDPDDPYYKVTVSDDHAEALVSVDTYIHAAPEGGGT